MTYSSIIYIFCFFPVSLLLYALTPVKHRNKTLLLLSMIFCGTFSLSYMMFMLVYVTVNYTCGRLCGKLKESGKRGTLPFVFALTADICALIAARSQLFEGFRGKLDLPDGAFPIGISLFTLSAAGYLIEIFTGKLKPEKHILRFSLYIMMFPRLIMGPIVSYGQFKRIHKKRRMSLDNIGEGMALFIKGLVKKVLIADNMYTLYTAVRSVENSELSVVTAWMGMISFILCLYFTLSGLSDMGAGASLCFGYRFPRSFRYPLFSSRFGYFAARWHIQPVRWFRRCVTRPLCAQTQRIWLRRFIYVAVWGLTGYWYGFTVGSLTAGLLLGIACLAEHYLVPKKTMKATGIMYTALGIMIFTVFFAPGGITNSLSYLWAMIGGTRLIADSLTFYLLRSYLAVLLITIYGATDLSRTMLLRAEKTRFSGVIWALRPAAVVLMLALCTAFIATGGSSGEMIIRL